MYALTPLAHLDCVYIDTRTSLGFGLRVNALQIKQHYFATLSIILLLCIISREQFNSDVSFDVIMHHSLYKLK